MVPTPLAAWGLFCGGLQGEELISYASVEWTRCKPPSRSLPPTAIRTSLFALAFVSGIAIALYGLVRAIGWVIGGFAAT